MATHLAEVSKFASHIRVTSTRRRRTRLGSILCAVTDAEVGCAMHPLLKARIVDA